MMKAEFFRIKNKHTGLFFSRKKQEHGKPWTNWSTYGQDYHSKVQARSAIQFSTIFYKPDLKTNTINHSEDLLLVTFEGGVAVKEEPFYEAVVNLPRAIQGKRPVSFQEEEACL